MAKRDKADEERAARLAASLRDNLRRRKAQARTAGAEPPATDADKEDAPPAR